MTDQFNQIIGLTAGILTSCSLLPQLIKTLRLKEAEHISPGMFILLMAGTGLWTYYGVLREDLPLIITNAFSFSLNCTMLFLNIRYRNR
ncbi:MAG TPA: SemiSWEET transporter [Sphingobacteriaceae bacterium]